MTKHVPGYPFVFDSEACLTCPGRCCNGEHGNVWVSRKEIASIAEFLGIDVEGLTMDYLRRINGCYSIKDLKIDGNYACVFFDERQNGCGIYPVRPEQCRTFPFWPYFKEHPEKVFEECPGVSPISDAPQSNSSEG